MALFFSVRSIAKSITRDIFYEGSSRARVRRKTSFGWTVVSSIKIIIKINARQKVGIFLFPRRSWFWRQNASYLFFVVLVFPKNFSGSPSFLSGLVREFPIDTVGGG